MSIARAATPAELGSTLAVLLHVAFIGIIANDRAASIPAILFSNKMEVKKKTMKTQRKQLKLLRRKATFSEMPKRL